MNTKNDKSFDLTANKNPALNEELDFDLLRFKRTIYNRNWRNANKEKIAEYQKKYNKEYNRKNKEALRKHKNEYYKNNKKAILDRQRERYSENKPTYKKRQKSYCRNNNNDAYKNWAKKNKEKVAGLHKKWKQKQLDTNPLFKVTQKLRTAVYQAFKRIGCNKPCDTQTLLGCTYEEAKIHIESLFQEGMAWENHGIYTWHIDHIRPVSTFKLDEIHLMNHISNLQPMWAKENLTKHNKWHN